MADNELQFILKMRDEASAILKQHAQSFGTAATGAKGLKDSADQAGESMSHLVKHAQEAAEAVISLWAANEMAHKANEAFSEYEAGMLAISRTTQIAGVQMQQFQQSFDQMAAKTKGVSPESLLEFSEVAGQLGIRGSQNVLNFAETIGKLTTVTNISGEEGAKQFGRLLLLTGEGEKGVKKLADSLVGLQADTKASASEILMLASNLAQTTAGFNVTTATLTGFSAAAAQLNIQPYLFSNAAGRALRELRDGALNNTEGFQDLSKSINMNREDFIKLMDTHPELALLKFLDVLKKTNQAGVSTTGFLTKFQLQGDESQKVLITLAQHVDEVNSKIQESKNLQDKGGSLDNAYAGFGETLKAELAGAQTAIELFWKNLGQGAAPAMKALLELFTSTLNAINAVFSAMPDFGKSFVAWAAIGVPAIIALQRVLSLFDGVFAGVNAGLVTLGRQFGVTAAQATVAAEETAVAEATMAGGGAGGALAGKSGGLLRGAGAVTIAASLVEPAKQLGGWIGDKIGDGLIEYAPSLAEKIYTTFYASKEKAKEKAAADDSHEGGHKKAEGTPDLGDNQVANALTAQQKSALERIDSFKKLQDEIKAASTALEALERLSKQTPGVSDARSEEEIARMRGKIEMEKRKLDPAQDRARTLGIEAEKVQAITQMEKNRLEIEAEIRSLIEKQGAASDAEKAKITGAVAALQEARKAAALAQDRQTFTTQLASAKAITQAEKDRVAILQQIQAFERQNGELSDRERASMAGRLVLLKQIAEYTQQMDQLNPQAKGIRDYNDQLTILNQRLKQGLVSQQEYAREKTKLDNDTLATRNPLGNIADTQQQEIDALRVVGEYRDADVKTLKQITDLEKQGLTITKQAAAAMSEYNRAMQDAEKAKSSGFSGWASQIGSIKDNLMDLEKDFASGLSSAISGALSGQKGQFTALAQSIGKKMLDIGINQLMKQAMGGLGLLDTGKAALAHAQSATDAIDKAGISQTAATAAQGDAMTKALQNMSAANMTVTAASVIVNGGVGAVPGAAPGAAPGAIPGAAGGPTAPTDVNIAGVGGQNLTTPTIPFQMPGANAAPVLASAPDALGGVGGLGGVGALGAFGLAGFKSLGGAGPTGVGTIGMSGLSAFKLPGAANQNNPFGSLDSAAESFAPKALPNAFKGGVQFGEAGAPGIGSFGAGAFGGLAPGGAAASIAGAGKQLQLSSQDIVDMKKTLMTEWVPKAGDDQGKGIIDTLMNRQASGHWGGSMHDVVDARKQFSDINGPVAWKHGRTSVDDIPDSQLASGRGLQSSQFVDKYLAERAGGAKSVVGDNLNYANPKFSDAKNLAWINKLDGPKLGSGNAVHWHGTTDDLQKFRPGQVQPTLPGQARGVGPMPTGSIGNQGLQQQMQVARQQQQQLAQVQKQGMQQQLQAAKQGEQQLTQNMKQAGQSMQQVGQDAQQTIPKLSGFNTDLGQMAPKLTQTAPAFTGMDQGIQSMTQQLASGPGVMDTFSQSLQKMLSSMGSGGGLGGIGGLLGGLFHEGGVVGAGAPASGFRMVGAGTWTHASRFHSGLKDDEYPAILQKGERVLTANDNARTQKMMKGMTDHMAKIGGPAAGNGQGGSQKTVHQTMNFNVTSQDANSFRKSKSQLMADAGVHMQRMAMSNN
jgi:hypothetical protein